jgi:hypothetical protein
MRTQLEALQNHLVHRNSAQVLSNTTMVNECQFRRERPVIPGLNTPTELVDNEDVEDVEVPN